MFNIAHLYNSINFYANYIGALPKSSFTKVQLKKLNEIQELLWSLYSEVTLVSLLPSSTDRLLEEYAQELVTLQNHIENKTLDTDILLNSFQKLNQIKDQAFIEKNHTSRLGRFLSVLTGCVGAILGIAFGIPIGAYRGYKAESCFGLIKGLFTGTFTSPFFLQKKFSDDTLKEVKNPAYKAKQIHDKVFTVENFNLLFQFPEEKIENNPSNSNKPKIM